MTLDELNGQMAVLAAVQLRQTEIQKIQAEESYAIHGMLANIRQGMEAHERQIKDHDRRMKDWDERIEKLVSGFGAFLRENRMRE